MAETRAMPPAGPVPERLATALAKIGMALRTQAWRRGHARGLTPTQAQALATLARDRTPGGARLAVVAERLGVTSATASEAVAALVRKGLVRRAPAADDGRAVALALTDEGAAEAQQVAGWSDFLAESLESLPLADQEALLRILLGLIRSLQERGEIPTTAMCVTCTHFRPRVHADPRRPHHCAFVDAPFGDRDLRLDCPDHREAEAELSERLWLTFTGAREEER